MRKLTVIAVLLLLIAGAAYLYYVRGVDVSAQIPRPETIKRAGGVRTYTWDVATAMPTPRTEVAAAALGGKLYLVGGVGPEGLANELYVYDTVADHWEERRPAPARRDHLAAAALHGRLYLGGGREQSLSKNLATLEVYDPRADTWKVGANMPTARGGVAGAAFDGLFVVAGGERPRATHAEVEAFDPESGLWLSTPFRNYTNVL